MALRQVAAACFLATAFLVADHAGFSEGTCGGVMRGYDSRSYTCEADRKPVCEQSTGRCVCLARRECGSRTDEPF